LKVDLQDSAEFITFNEETGEFKIEDLADPLVPSGTFMISVSLSDGKDSVVADISVIIYDPPTVIPEEVTPIEEIVEPEAETAKEETKLTD